MWLTAKKRGKIPVSVFLAAHGFDSINKISDILTSFPFLFQLGRRQAMEYGMKGEGWEQASYLMGYSHTICTEMGRINPGWSFYRN